MTSGRRTAKGLRQTAALLCALLCAACSSPPSQQEPPRPDPTKEPGYLAAINQLQGLVEQAEAALKNRDLETVGDLVTRGQPLSASLLSVPRPTLPATKAVSDLDQLYAELLFRRRHIGWARLLAQKDVVRWRNWRPQTEETQALLKRAETTLTKLDRALSQ